MGKLKGFGALACSLIVAEMYNTTAIFSSLYKFNSSINKDFDIREIEKVRKNKRNKSRKHKHK